MGTINAMRSGPYSREVELARQMRRSRRGRRRNDPATAWSFVVIGLVVMGMFVPLFADEVGAYRRQAGVTALPSVTGEVLESRVLSEERQSFNTSVSQHTEPVIRYRYEVNGRPYESSRFAFQEFILLRDECEAIVARHRPGSSVNVYYEPGDPEMAAISTRPAVLNSFIVALCGTMWLVGGIAVFSGLRSRPWQADLERHAEPHGLRDESR